MSDHAKTVARLCAPMPAEAYEALDALVAEREVDRQRWADTDHLLGQALARAEAAEAERDEALRGLEETVEAYHARLREKSAAEAELAAYKQAFYAANVANDRAEAAEARITELEAALEVAALEIIAWQKHAGVFDYPEHRKIIERIDAFLVTKEDTDE